jgi:hypothetical protein
MLLRSAKKNSDETFSQFMTRIHVSWKRWVALAGKKETSAEDVTDMMLYEQLLESVTPELALFIRERKPADCWEAGRLADVFAEARRAARVDRRSGSADHSQPSQEDEQQPQTESCHHCGEVGHFKRDCPELQRREKSLTVQVLASTITGVSSGVIEKGSVYSASIAGTLAVGLRDTGCSTVIVNSRWVPQPMRELGKVEIYAFDSTVRSYPVVAVEVVTPFFQGVVQAVAVENALYPLIIGNVVRFIDGQEREVSVQPSAISRDTLLHENSSSAEKNGAVTASVQKK